MTGIFILLAVHQMLSLNEAYNFTCPSQAHWNFRAKSRCKPPSNYTCLFDVTYQINIYRDKCNRPRILGSGYKYVFQPNLNRAACSVNRYQPFIFETIGNSDCTFQKSFCNSLGQKTYGNGNSTVDRKCICNTDRGYFFVYSKNQCYCNPSTEDCSCYLRNNRIDPYNKTIGLKDIKCYDDMKLTRSPFLDDMFNISRTIKIIEFDNVKYNLNYYPSHKYSIKAAKSVLTLLLVCVVVSIIVLRIVQRWIQFRNTPRRFDIVECSDCSITTIWYIHEQGDTLDYELNYRIQKTDKWTVKTFSTKDVWSEENGRRMYILLKILPDTGYELKLCSVDGHFRSQYSESKSTQTLKKRETISQLSEEDKDRYKKLIQGSQTENRYFVRIMLVGKETAGKTSLSRRLLSESISDVSSTDDGYITVRRCKINVEDGQWTIDKDIDDDKANRILRAIAPNKDTKNATMENREKHSVKLGKILKTKGNAQDDLSKIENNVFPEEITHYVSDEKTKATDMSVVATKEGNITHRGKLIIKEKIDENLNDKEASLLVMPPDLMSSVFSYSATHTPSNLYALCELWDFAGKREFYATHQAFLTSYAVYLVVADINDDISKQGISQCFADFYKVGEYVDFWFDSIHCHRTDDIKVKEHFDPPILLVFTHTDKCDEEYILKRKKEIDKQLESVLGKQGKHHHLHKKFYLSNTDDQDDEINKLRSAIFDAARKMDNWGQALPLKWILLEHLIDINKAQGHNFINFTDMVNMAKHPDINILEEQDLFMFLRFEHNLGNIIFFENIPDLIILKPQWLADAFRCLVSESFDTRLHHLEDWILFKQQGKINKSLISKLFEAEQSSQFSGQKEHLYKIMEKFDILVKIQNSRFDIMPSRMPASTFEDVCESVGFGNIDCKRTSWLCLKFDFLPPSFFNHLSAWFIRNYNPSKLDSDFELFVLYRGICMFDIDRSGCVKILVTMSTDTIALQVVTFSKQREVGNTCSNIYSKVKDVIEKIRQNYKVKISFKLHFKCSDGDYYKDTFAYETLKHYQEYYCTQHKTAHQADLIYTPWMKNEVEKIPDNRAKIRTEQDDINPKNEHNKENELAQDQSYVKTNIPVFVNLRKQLKIKISKNERLDISSCIKIGNQLVFTDCENYRLIFCDAYGTDSDIHHIPLPYKQWDITELDSDTVAVSCNDKTILIINISTRAVTSTIKTSDLCYGISYNDNNLYVVIDYRRIEVIDLSGKVLRNILLPSDYIHDITVDRNRLVCIDVTSVYCCSLDGIPIWKFEEDTLQDLFRVTTDDEGIVYVTENVKHTVVVISGDNRRYKEILTVSDGLSGPSGIYFDRKENALLVCNPFDGNAFLFDVKKKLTYIET